MRVYSSHIPDYITIKWCEDPAKAIQRLPLSNFDRLVFITHGFTSDIETSWMYDVKNAMMIQEADKHTVAIVGWGGGSGTIDYPLAAANTQAVGKWVQKFARAAKQQHHVYLYGVGFSLGAHVVGAAARTREDRSQRSDLFDRITGLDPAGPGFEDSNLDKGIGPNDAKMVDIIHTCG